MSSILALRIFRTAAVVNLAAVSTTLPTESDALRLGPFQSVFCRCLRDRAAAPTAFESFGPAWGSLSELKTAVLDVLVPLKDAAPAAVRDEPNKESDTLLFQLQALWDLLDLESLRSNDHGAVKVATDPTAQVLNTFFLGAIYPGYFVESYNPELSTHPWWSRPPVFSDEVKTQVRVE